MDQLFTPLNAQVLEIKTILFVLFFTFLLSLYEFIVYRFVSYKVMYDKQLNVSIAVLPFFISTIILALQSNIVITLGTIGALAIIRYRTAVKNPINMTYLLWAVHIGIVCGCQLYTLGFITSFAASVMIFILERVKINSQTYILLVKSTESIEERIKESILNNGRRLTIKNRTYSQNGYDYVIELVTKTPNKILEDISNIDVCTNVSLIEYDTDSGLI